MGEKKLLASGAHDIYLENGKAVKLFAKGFPKAEVLREAMHQSLAQERGIKVPSVEGVTAGADGRWAIISEYIEGETRWEGRAIYAWQFVCRQREGALQQKNKSQEKFHCKSSQKRKNAS